MASAWNDKKRLDTMKETLKAHDIEQHKQHESEEAIQKDPKTRDMHQQNVRRSKEVIRQPALLSHSHKKSKQDDEASIGSLFDDASQDASYEDDEYVITVSPEDEDGDDTPST